MFSLLYGVVINVINDNVFNIALTVMNVAYIIFSCKGIYFSKLAETKNFAEVLECLSITTSTLRYSILNFEKELGKSLVVKKEMSIESTEYG